MQERSVSEAMLMPEIAKNPLLRRPSVNLQIAQLSSKFTVQPRLGANFKGR